MRISLRSWCALSLTANPGENLMRHRILPIVTGLTLMLISAPASATMVFSEIMYNPNSPEADWEWIELYNPLLADHDLSGYVIDDINSLAHVAANIASGVVPAGGSAVLYNADAITLGEFEVAWGSGINLIPVTKLERNGAQQRRRHDWPLELVR